MTGGSRTKVHIVALTPAGAALGHRLAERLGGAILWLPAKFTPDFPTAQTMATLKDVFREAFQTKKPLVGIMATGIVVRQLAPFLRGKDRDPAVVVLDEQGQFAISLLSGHLGGANDLARTVADLVGATAVITTATDAHGLPALDTIAVRLGLSIENLSAVKAIHLALLQGQKVRVVDPLGFLREELAGWPELFEARPEAPESFCQPGPGVYVGCRDYPWPEGWLRLRPKIMVAGMGCNRGASQVEILDLFEKTLKQFHLSPLCLHTLATISAKRDEAGLKAAAEHLGVRFIWFSKEELQHLPVPNPSAVVQRHLGVASVCEAAALKAAKGGTLLVPKQKSTNVTLAVAQVG